jgi:hypothetical protein
MTTQRIVWCASCRYGLDRLRGRLRDGRLRLDMAWRDLFASLTSSPALGGPVLP